MRKPVFLGVRAFVYCACNRRTVVAGRARTALYRGVNPVDRIGSRKGRIREFQQKGISTKRGFVPFRRFAGVVWTSRTMEQGGQARYSDADRCPQQAWHRH
jgi:hypothetical protein